MGVLRLVLLLTGVFLILDPSSQAKADYEKGLKAAENEDYQIALAEWTIDAKQGHPKAQNGIGFLYQNGWGVPKDYEEAIKWYRLSADQNYASAQNNLGVMYNNGWGVPKDYQKAIKWYRLAADQGHAQAQNNLGIMFFKGWGVQQDFEQAAHWYRLSADKGHEWAQTNLGYLYENGMGVPKNINEAVDLYRLAAEQGNNEAFANLKRVGFAETQNQTNAPTTYEKAKYKWENIPTSIKVISYIILTIITVIAYYKTVKIGRDVYGLKLIFSASFGLILLSVGLAITAFYSYDIIVPAKNTYDYFQTPAVTEYGIDLYIYSSASGLCFLGAFIANIKNSNLSMGIYFTLAQILTFAFFFIAIFLVVLHFLDESKRKYKL